MSQSSKEVAIRLIRDMPDAVSTDAIITQLTTTLRALDALDYDDSELTDEEWMLFVAQGLADELNDPREDIYTLDDGTPADAGE